MNHGSLFSGIGGFDLAAEWMQWNNVFHCEWNKFGQKVLKHYWPNAESFEDITKTDFTKYANKIDILTGGFPCQPYSSAGKRKGKKDERHLWPEMLRAIREIQPRYVVGENVRGLTNWNGGLVFDEVQADLEAEGYEVTPFLLPACAVNAPHRRDRIWFVAYSNKCTKRSPRTSRETQSNGSQNNDEQSRRRKQAKQHIRCGNVQKLNTNGNGQHQRNGKHEEYTGKRRFHALNDVGTITTTNATSERRLQNNRQGKSRQHDKKSESYNWQNFPTQSPICSGDDGLPNQLDGITFPKWRQESIKAYGNAIVPQVAFEIFKAIKLSEND